MAGIELLNVWGAMDSVMQGVLVPDSVIHPHGKNRAEVFSEERLELLRDGVRLMVQQFADGPEYEDVVEAYDAGLSTGFYTKPSAIAQGFRTVTARRFLDMRREHRRAYAISLRKIYAIGFHQGRLLATGLWNE